MSEKVILDKLEHSEGIIFDKTNNGYRFTKEQFLLKESQPLPDKITYKSYGLGVRGEIKRKDIYEEDK